MADATQKKVKVERGKTSPYNAVSFKELFEHAEEFRVRFTFGMFEKLNVDFFLDNLDVKHIEKLMIKYMGGTGNIEDAQISTMGEEIVLKYCTYPILEKDGDNIVLDEKGHAKVLKYVPFASEEVTKFLGSPMLSDKVSKAFPPSALMNIAAEAISACGLSPNVGDSITFNKIKK